jgi:hypothetical protein
MLVLATAASLLGCSLTPGDRTPIWAYRVVDDRTLSVRVDTAAGWETWVASVLETDATVTVEVRTRRPGGTGADVGVPIWLEVGLTAPLGDRTVIDAAASMPVDLGP